MIFREHFQFTFSVLVRRPRGTLDRSGSGTMPRLFGTEKSGALAKLSRVRRSKSITFRSAN